MSRGLSCEHYKHISICNLALTRIHSRPVANALCQRARRRTQAYAYPHNFSMIQMPQGRKRKGKSKTNGGATSSSSGGGSRSSSSSLITSSPEPPSLLRLPRALQVNCLEFLTQQGIAAVASTCDALNEFSSLRVCCVEFCPCRWESMYSIATTTKPEGWFWCSACQARFGCPRSQDQWTVCCGCNEWFCSDCVDSDNVEGYWLCRPCFGMQHLLDI